MERFIFIMIIGLFALNTNCVSQVVADKKNCIDCHENLTEQKTVHPSKDNCEDCHKPNGNEHPKEGVLGFVLAEKIPVLCYNCHESVGKDKVLHQPATDGNCMVCHDAHQSNHPKLLLSNEKELCLKCHDKKINYGKVEIINIKELLNKSNFVHSAIDSGCTVCHSPHSSDNTFRFTKHFPGGEEYLQASKDSFALCFSCHDSKLFEDAFTRTATNFRIGNQNLHYLHVNREKSRNCNRCHDVHGANNDFQIKETVQFGHWEMPINFKKINNGGSCFPGCHTKKEYNRFGIPTIDSLSANLIEKRLTQNTDDISPSETDNNKSLNEFRSLKFTDIKFVYAKAQIVENTENKLINIINFLKKYPDTKIEVQGHTDNLGKDTMNIILSEQRAEVVKQLIVNQDIIGNRVRIVGYGESKPIAPDNTEKNRAKNRRVEIKLIR